MENEQSQITVVILENRQMIASILADLLTGAGYGVRLVQKTAEGREVLPQFLPAILLADLGLAGQEEQGWRALREAAEAFGTPVITFSCSALPGAEGVLVLRSPGDFAAVVGKVEQELQRKKSPLGMILVEMGEMNLEELEAVLRIQKDLALVGRKLLLGDLFVRLGFISPEVLQQALQAQEGRNGSADRRRGSGTRKP